MRRGHKLVLRNRSSKDIEETTCHPSRDPGSLSSMLFCPGHRGWSLTKSLQPGARKPASNNVCRESPTAWRYDPGASLVNAVTNCSATAGCRFAVVTKQSATRRSLDSPLAHSGGPIHPVTTIRTATSNDSGGMSAPRIRCKQAERHGVVRSKLQRNWRWNGSEEVVGAGACAE